MKWYYFTDVLELKTIFRERYLLAYFEKLRLLFHRQCGEELGEIQLSNYLQLSERLEHKQKFFSLSENLTR